MKRDRRSFLNQISAVAAITAFSKPLASVASVSRRVNTLHASGSAVTVYHTNDLHGNLGPVVDNIGGINQIKALLNSQETGGLLLDGGDFLNSSHSLGGQKAIINAMNSAGYHVAAIGNHELAQGQEHLALLIPMMNFSLVNCNYGFDAALGKLVKPYVIINSGKFKIGITGVGHQINGVKYNDAIASACDMAKMLKEQQKCDLVICLSHLGYQQKGDLPDNKKLVMQSEHIDMIVSGHNRKLLRGPMIMLNKNMCDVVIGHAGWDGMMMGKTVFSFNDEKQRRDVNSKHMIVGLQAGQDFTASYAKLRLLEKQLKTA